MRSPPPVHRALHWFRLVAVVLPVSASALQPLDAFIQSARDHSPDNADARAGKDAQDAQADVSLGRALPGAIARGSYTRNQYQIGPVGPLPPLLNESVYLQRFNQLDAQLTINVPLLDVASFERIAAARAGSAAAGKVVLATSLQVSATVTQTYFTLVANQALVTASERAVDIAKRNLQLSQARFEAGKGAALDVDLSAASLERQTQFLVAAQLQTALSARALESASGLVPDLHSQTSLVDDLHAEAPLETFERSDDDLPAIAAAVMNRDAAEQQATAQRLTLVPALSGSFTEHGTNAPSFIGQPWSYLAVLALSWQLDYSTFSAMRLQDAAAASARARETRTRLQVRDGIHAAWSGVAAAIAAGQSARAQQKAASHASELAQARYEAGRATELEMLRAQEDAFSADVARIQADASLANARLQLRLASGTDPFSNRGTP